MKTGKLTKTLPIAVVALFSAFLAGEAAAIPFESGIPPGWTQIGNAGGAGANGVVTASPDGGNYVYVTTDNGDSSVKGLGLGNEFNGSVLRSSVFSVHARDSLQFFFNYVTSDASGYADYAWARLIDTAAGGSDIILFTARTTPGGNTVPGMGMPPIEGSTTPGVVTIVPDKTEWSPLGSDSGTCFFRGGPGCGYTGWTQANYEFTTAGDYILEFGVVNWGDDKYQSGLAIDGLELTEIPEPAPLALFGLGLLGLGAFRRRANDSIAQ